MTNERIPECRDWIFGDIAVDENGKQHTYPFAMMLSFRTLEDFRAAHEFIKPLLGDTK